MEELLKQMVTANLQMQQAHLQAQAHQEEMIALQSAQLEVQQNQLSALAEQVRSAVAPSNQGTGKPSSYLQKLTPHDDVEAYLTTFERTAERETWPQDQWAGILAPFLTGEPQRAYCNLPVAVAEDYTMLKGEILARLGVTTTVRAHRVHDWPFHPDRSPQSQMHDLLQLATKWLQPEQLTGTQIVERVAMDRYLRALPEALQRWVSLEDPNTLTQLVELVERYQVTEELQRPPRPRGAALQRRPSAIILWSKRQPNPESHPEVRGCCAGGVTPGAMSIPSVPYGRNRWSAEPCGELPTMPSWLVPPTWT
ncbi:uncharacterized protein ACMZJ9_009478 [Mantella aurantiaca]